VPVSKHSISFCLNPVTAKETSDHRMSEMLAYQSLNIDDAKELSTKRQGSIEYTSLVSLDPFFVEQAKQFADLIDWKVPYVFLVPPSLSWAQGGTEKIYNTREKLSGGILL